jgi:hypothetical protein
VTSVSVTTANGVSGTVATSTTTPAISLTLGAITPTSVDGLTISTTTGTLTIPNGTTLTGPAGGGTALVSGGALGTPSSGTLTNATGLPLNGVISPASAPATIADGNFPVTFSSAQTSNTQSAINFIEASAATGGSGNNEVAMTTLANSTSTVLNLTQGAISTVFPTAAINVTQGSNTGATAVPILNLNTTWNDASLVGSGVKINITNTSSAATSAAFQINAGTGGATQEFVVGVTGVVVALGNIETAGSFTGTVGTTPITIGSGTLTFATNAAAPAFLAQGEDASNTGAATAGGLALLRGGMLTAATPSGSALEGGVEVGAGYLKGTAIASVGDVVCATTTAFTVTDCAVTPGTNIVGIATSTTNPIGVVSYGLVPVKLDGALTAIGDNVCMGTTTAGAAHDNGSTTTACAVGTGIGVIVADSGTFTSMTGNTTGTQTLSTTLVLVQLRLY